MIVTPEASPSPEPRRRPGRFDPYDKGATKPQIEGVEVLGASELLIVLACIELRHQGKSITLRKLATAINRSINATKKCLERLHSLGLVTFHQGSAAWALHCGFVDARKLGRP